MRKLERDYNCEELILGHGVTRGPNDEFLSSMDYRSLVSLLAVREAVNS